VFHDCSNILTSFQGDITRKLIFVIELYGLGFWVVVEYTFHNMEPSGAGAEAPTPLGFQLCRCFDASNNTVGCFVVDLKPPFDQCHSLIGITSFGKSLNPIRAKRSQLDFIRIDE